MKRARKASPATAKPPLSAEQHARVKASREQRKEEKKAKKERGRKRAVVVTFRKLWDERKRRK